VENEYILCNKCQQSIHINDSITTIKNKILCFGCDSKRLIKEQ
jgi:DNA-directed RNA polymerase subunit RPC12/RpoP